MSDQIDSLPSTPTPPPIPQQQKKKGMSTGCIVGLVLGVVGLAFAMLALLAVAGGYYAKSTAFSLQARVQLKSLEMAVKGYQTEYNRLPSSQSPPPTSDNSPGYDTTTAEGKAIIDILTAVDTSKNPRGISFYEPPPARTNRGGYTPDHGLVDIWDAKGYLIIFDYDGDKKIADPEHPGATIEATVIIYSAGPDGDFSTWKDNVKSWGR